MELIPAIGLTVAALLILSKVSAAAAFQQLQFSAGNFNVSQQGLTTLVNFNVNAYNPTNTPISVRSIVANLSVAGNPIGQATSFTPTTIQPNNVTALPVTAALYDLSIVNTVLKAIATPSPGTVAELTGQVNAAGIDIPVDLKYALS